MLKFPLLCKPEDAAGVAQAAFLLDAAESLTVYVMTDLPDCPERVLAMQHLSEAVLWAHQAILRAAAAPRVVVARPNDVPDFFAGSEGRN